MSAVVIDTHILIWDQLDPARLSSKAKRALNKANTDHHIVISEISLWEISILMMKGRLAIDVPYLEFITFILHTRNYSMKGIDPEIAFMASQIKIDSKDPADRIISATSISLGIPLITSDQSIRSSEEVITIW